MWQIYFKCQVCGKIEIGRINFQLPRHATKTLGDVFNPRNILNELVSKHYLDVLGAQTMILWNLLDNTISMLIVIEQKNTHSYWHHQVKKYPNRCHHFVTSWLVCHGLSWSAGLVCCSYCLSNIKIISSFFFSNGQIVIHMRIIFYFTFPTNYCNENRHPNDLSTDFILESFDAFFKNLNLTYIAHCKANAHLNPIHTQPTCTNSGSVPSYIDLPHANDLRQMAGQGRQTMLCVDCRNFETKCR